MAPPAPRIAIRDLNPHIICVLCSGYFIDPVTITECLHSFCKSCLVKYVETKKQCPICDLTIHKTKPLMNVKSDKTLQDIVYKLVPGLHRDEITRRQIYYRRNGPPKGDQYYNFREEREKIFFSEADKFSLSIQYFEAAAAAGSQTSAAEHRAGGKSKENSNKRYLECPGLLKMKHLKKFIVKKYGLTAEEFLVEVIYKDEIIPEEYTIIDVAYLHNYRKDRPMQFFYRIFRKNRVLLRKRKLQNVAATARVDGGARNSMDSSGSTTHAAGSSNNNHAPSAEAKRPRIDGAGGGDSSRPAPSTTTSSAMMAAAASSTSGLKTGPKPPEHHTSWKSEARPKTAVASPTSVRNPAHAQSSSSVNRPSGYPSLAPKPAVPTKPAALPLPMPETIKSMSVGKHQSSLSIASPKSEVKINVSAQDVQKIVAEMKNKEKLARENADKKTGSHSSPAQSNGAKQVSSSSSPSVGISAEQKMAIRNFRPGGQQAGSQSEKILNEIVKNLTKKQLESSPGSKRPMPAAPGASPTLAGQSKTTIQRTTVSSINLGGGERRPALTSSSNSLQKGSSMSAAERHLAKNIPSSTTITVKHLGGSGGGSASDASNGSNKYNNKDGVITPSIKKVDKGNSDSVKKSLSDRSLMSMSEALMKQKQKSPVAAASPAAGNTDFFRKAAQAAAANSSIKTTAGVSPVAAPAGPQRLQFNASPALSTANAAAAAHAMAAMAAQQHQAQQQLVNVAAAAAAAAANIAAVSSLAHQVTTVPSAIPTNRLQLKQPDPIKPSPAVPQIAPKPASTKASTPVAASVTPPAATLATSNLLSFSNKAKDANSLKPALSSGDGNGGGGAVNKLSKTLQNQGIRQIPNPSLLTKPKTNGTADLANAAAVKTTE